ncbi:hypothetical protein DFH29DRAFT_909395 [Suillus ampliporus]|nr:hypothetical protein DFH29DRAFT_909395 [Suillus ampliporus]
MTGTSMNLLNISYFCLVMALGRPNKRKLVVPSFGQTGSSLPCRPRQRYFLRIQTTPLHVRSDNCAASVRERPGIYLTARDR